MCPVPPRGTLGSLMGAVSQAQAIRWHRLTVNDRCEWVEAAVAVQAESVSCGPQQELLVILTQSWEVKLEGMWLVDN